MCFISIAWQARIFYILEKQNAKLVELKRMISVLVKNTTATCDNDEPSLPERINCPLESEEAYMACWW